MKLFHFVFVFLLIAVTTFFVLQYQKSTREEAITKASEQLTLTRDIRIAQLKGEVKTFYSEISFWVESKSLKAQMQKILSSWYELSFAPKSRARQLYIDGNPFFPYYSANFVHAGDDSNYSKVHKTLHKLLKSLTSRRGYYDVFLIANNGDIVYTVFKEDDYATNIINGKYDKTTLAQGFREVQENTNLNHVALTDFKPYAPSKNAPASFIQTSVMGENNKAIGVLAFQLPIETIDLVITNQSGLAKGTEIFAVGNDHFKREKVESLGKRFPITSDAIELALKDKVGVGEFIDYKGNKTITAYAPFEFSDNVLGNTDKNTWAVIVKQDISEILMPVNKKLRKELILLITLILISLFFAWFLTRAKADVRITEDDTE